MVGRLYGQMEGTFEQAWAAYGAQIFGYLVRMTRDRPLAEELCQETFLRLLRHRDGIRAQNGTLAPWLYRVATRLVLDERRRRRPPVALSHDPAVEGRAEESAGNREIDGRIRLEVDRLPPELRAAFLLRAHQELTFPQVAAATGVSERAAKDRFRRARDILLTRLAPLHREIRP